MQRLRSEVRWLRASVVLTMCGACAAAAVPPEELEQIRAAAPDAAPVKSVQPRRLLIHTACQGFVHSSIPYCTAALQIIGEKTGAYEAIVSDDPAVFKPASLAKFDAVCFNNTTGELFDDPASRQALLDFVRGGKGVIGIHAATDCFYKWPEFGELMGGYFAGHPWNEEVTIKIDEPQHPVVEMFKGQPFAVADEIYQFKEPYSRRKLRVLLSLDVARTNMKKDGLGRTDNDYAVSWVHNCGLGRVFYCSLGHRHEIFWNPPILKHYLAGIQFALGDLPADALPSAQLEADGWARLFNGQDLTGWIAKPGSWRVEDGILARAGGGYIWTEQVYDDFVLEAEFKLAPRANSGIFFRTADINDCVQTGLEMQVFDSYDKAEPDKHDCGAIYDCLAPARNAVKRAGEWNRVVLTCRGSRIEVVLNGEPIIDMDLDRWTEVGRNPDGTGNKFRTAYRDMPRAGRIGFQDHGDAVWYRNVRLRRLAP